MRNQRVIIFNEPKFTILTQHEIWKEKNQAIKRNNIDELYNNHRNPNLSWEKAIKDNLLQ